MDIPKLVIIEFPSLDLKLPSLDLDVQPLKLEPLLVLEALPITKIEQIEIPKLAIEPVKLDLELVVLAT